MDDAQARQELLGEEPAPETAEATISEDEQVLEIIGGDETSVEEAPSETPEAPKQDDSEQWRSRARDRERRYQEVLNRLTTLDPSGQIRAYAKGEAELPQQQHHAAMEPDGQYAERTVADMTPGELQALLDARDRKRDYDSALSAAQREAANAYRSLGEVDNQDEENALRELQRIGIDHRYTWPTQYAALLIKEVQFQELMRRDRERQGQLAQAGVAKRTAAAGVQQPPTAPLTTPRESTKEEKLLERLRAVSHNPAEVLARSNSRN